MLSRQGANQGGRNLGRVGERFVVPEGQLINEFQGVAGFDVEFGMVGSEMVSYLPREGCFVETLLPEADGKRVDWVVAVFGH